jgi:hypothetical protein
LRHSNAYNEPTGEFFYQTYSKSNPVAAGEELPNTEFTAELSFISTTPTARQEGLNMTISPDNGVGARMAYVGGARRRPPGLPDHGPQPRTSRRPQPPGLRSHPAPDDLREYRPQAASHRPPALPHDPAPAARPRVSFHLVLQVSPDAPQVRVTNTGDITPPPVTPPTPAVPQIPGAPAAPGAPPAVLAKPKPIARDRATVRILKRVRPKPPTFTG